MCGIVVLLVCSCLGAASISEAAVQFDRLVTPCKLKDPLLNDCLTTQGRAMIPHIVAGIKEWGILPMNPLFVPQMQLQRNEGGSIGISISVENSTHFGWDTMQIKSIKMDTKNYNFDVTWRFPKYQFLGTGQTSGRIILLPIMGNGAANMTFIDIDAHMTVKCATEKIAGKKHLKVSDTNVELKIKKLIMRLDNLFNNKQLSDTMNKVLNDNSLDIFEELKGRIQEIFSDIVSTVLSRMFSKVPLSKMFGDYEERTVAST